MSERAKIGINLSELDQRCEIIALNDTMRTFHGDLPATAIKDGNQKGENDFCPRYDVHLCLTDDIAHCYRQKVRSLGVKQHKTFSRVYLGELTILEERNYHLKIECKST